MVDNKSQQDPISRLYNNIKNDYDLPDFNTFKADMSDSTKASKLHSALIKDGYEMPSFDVFSVDMGLKKKDGGIVSSPTVSQSVSKSFISSLPEQKSIYAPTQKIASESTRVVAPKETKLISEANKRGDQITKEAIANSNDLYLKSQNKGGYNFTKEDPSILNNKKELEQDLKDGTLQVVKSPKTGKYVLAYKADMLKSFSQAWDGVLERQANDKYVAGLSTEDKIKHYEAQDILNQDKYLETAPAGFSGSVGRLLGENAEPLIKLAAMANVGGKAAQAAGATAQTVANAQKFGSFLAFATDAGYSGYANNTERVYKSLRQQDPNGNPVEQMRKAENAGLIGEVSGIGMAAGMTGIFKNLKGAAETINTKPFVSALETMSKHTSKEAAVQGSISTLNSIVSDLGAKSQGMDIGAGDILENALESGKQMAQFVGVTGLAMGTLTGLMKVPGYVKAQAKGLVSELPREEVKAVYEGAEANGIVPEGTTDKVINSLNQYDKAKEKLPEGLTEDKKASLTGIQEKIDKLEESKKKLAPQYHDRVDNTIKTLKDRAIKILESKDPLAEEVDNTLGVKGSEEIAGEPAFPAEVEVTEEVTPTEVKVTEDIESKKSSIEKERQADLDDLKKGIPAMITKKLESDLKQYGFTDAQINKMTPIVANETLIDAKYKAKLSSLEGVKPEVKVTEEVKPTEVKQPIKEEVKEIIEPIRQLGTGANVYFENNKYRVNDNSKGKFLLNIQGKEEGGMAIANIEFDSPKEAVEVAKELAKIYPSGVPDAVLIDKVVDDIRNKIKVKPTEVKVTEEVTPTGPSNVGAFKINGKNATESEFYEAYRKQNEVSFNGDYNPNPDKIEYIGNDNNIIQALENYERDNKTYEKDGSLGNRYMKWAISRAFNNVPFRKFASAFRKHIDNSFKAENEELKGMTFREFAGYMITDRNYDVTDKQFRKFAEAVGITIPERTEIVTITQPSEVKVKQEKTFAQKDLDRAEAKRIHSRVAEMDPPSDAEQVALRYLSEGGKVSQDAINEVSGTTKRASLNTGRRELKTEEAKARDYAGGKESLDDLAHRLWEASGQEISERDIKNALMAEIGNNNSRLDASKAYLERYNIEYQEEQYYERFIEEREEQHAKVQEELERDLRKPLEEEIEGMSSEEHINNLIKQYEAETKRENKQIGTEGKGEAVEEVSSRDTGKKAPEEAELAKEYKEAVSKVSKKAKENAKKDFVDRNFDNLVEKLKIQIKCPT